MGFLDTIKEKFANKGKAEDVARQHGDKIDDTVDRGGRAVDDRTGGKHSDQIRTGTDRTKDAMGKYTDEGGSGST